MELLNDTPNAPLRYIATDGTVRGQFYNSKDKLRHLAVYVPYQTPPSEYLCGGRGNFSPSRETESASRCPACFNAIADLTRLETTKRTTVQE